MKHLPYLVLSLNSFHRSSCSILRMLPAVQYLSIPLSIITFPSIYPSAIISICITTLYFKIYFPQNFCCHLLIFEPYFFYSLYQYRCVKPFLLYINYSLIIMTVLIPFSRSYWFLSHISFYQSNDISTDFDTEFASLHTEWSILRPWIPGVLISAVMAPSRSWIPYSEAWAGPWRQRGLTQEEVSGYWSRGLMLIETVQKSWQGLKMQRGPIVV